MVTGAGFWVLGAGVSFPDTQHLTPSTVLAVATALFGIGLYGLLQRRSLVAMLISLELMLAAVSINVVALTSRAGGDPVMGQVTVLILVGVAAAEAAVALSLFVAIHRAVHNIDVERLSEQKG